MGVFLYIYFKGILFLIEKERLVAQQSTGRNSAGCNCMPCPGFGGGWPRNPATGPCGREEVARLGSGSEIQLLVPQFLPPWGWHVDEGWLVAFPPVGREMSPGWSWGRQHPGETPAAETTSALGPISQELQIGAVGSKGPPGRLSRRSRNVFAPHSMWNNCLNPREEILSPEQLWGYDRKPAPLLPKIKQFILLFAISCSRKPWISSKTWQRCTLGHDEERNWLRWFGWVFFFWATAGLFLSEELCQRFQWLYPCSVVVDVGGAVNLPVRRCLQKCHVKQKFVFWANWRQKWHKLAPQLCQTVRNLLCWSLPLAKVLGLAWYL